MLKFQPQPGKAGCTKRDVAVGRDRFPGFAHQAVAGVLKAGKTRTPDLGGKATTAEMAEAVLGANYKSVDVFKS